MKFSSSGLLLFYTIFWISLHFHLVQSQKVVELVNTTRLIDYTNSTTFEHFSFDTPLQKNGKLVDYDENNIYALGRRSFADLSTFYFQTVSLANLSSSNITLTISGYNLCGMCQYQGTLDYFIGYHIETQEIRVCNIDSSNNTPLYCKAVPVTSTLETEYNIYADWKYLTTKNQKNVYIIGIGGSSLDSSNPGQFNYMYAKFNTLYNFTESIIESSDPLVSERLVDVKVDIVHNQIYVVLDINSNEYYGASIFKPGDERTLENPNVAILAYDFDNAVVNWVKIFGDNKYIDYYCDLEVNGNHIIVVTNSYTTNYATSVPSKDIMVHKFRYETGVTEGQLVLGSSVDDLAYDLVVSYQGMYILASIGNNFEPHPTSGAVWGTPNDGTAFGLIWINNKFGIVDIEGYDESGMTTIPLRAFPSLGGTYQPQFSFIGSASKTQTHGALFTQFENTTALYSSQDWNLTCPYCSRYTGEADCMTCNSTSGAYLYNGACYSSCPQASYLLSGKSICSSCHYSCKTCVGPKNNQCASCCTNGDCESSLFDKTSNLGKCEWPSGSYESHGQCLERCVNGLYGRLDKRCYEYCPRNTHSEIIWDDPLTSNEITHYDDSEDTDCVDYDHSLKFSALGNGIAVPGPYGLSSMPSEFTLSFWMRAELFNTETYLINLFNRVFVKASSMAIHFQFERSSGDIIEPTYSGSLNQVAYNQWVYVAVSQKEHKDSGTHHISQRIVIANGRTTDAVQAGTKDDHTTATYSAFNNEIFIGGLSYTSASKSFTGYIKEVKLFSKFHDSPQMIVDQLRAHQIYSFDDKYLIAYWKLSESFYSNSTIQEIKDYSGTNTDGNLNVEFSPITNPDYPSFVYNTTVGLKLWFYHDVANCKTVKDLPQIFSKAWRISNPDNFPLDSLSHTISVNDQILFKTGDCSSGTTMAKMTRINGGVWEADSSMPPENLEDGRHYSACYITAAEGYTISIGQIYISKTSTIVDPSDVSSFIIVGLTIQIDVSGGDEAYGDIIRFSEDCDSPKSTDHYLERKSNYIYSLLTTKDFQVSSNFKMCMMQTFMQGVDFYMDNINDHQWIATEIPTLSTSNPTAFYLNDGPLEFEFDTPLTEGDKIVFAWKRDTDFDCDSNNILSPEYEFKYGFLPMIWLGNDEGIHNITDEKEEIHMCWKSNAIGGDPSYSRVTYTGGYSYKFVVLDYSNTARITLPELSSIVPPFGSSELYGSDAQIQFNFETGPITPAKRSGTDGMIAIYRGAITYEGDIELIKTNPLVSITTLDDADGLTNGVLTCTATGSCNITLSTATSTPMASGEIYFLALFPNSFSNDGGGTNYLFANNTGGTSFYHSLFISRSFNIPDTPANTIYSSPVDWSNLEAAKYCPNCQGSNNFVIAGVNLLEITNANRKEYLGTIVNDTFTTHSIKIHLKFTGTTCNSNLLPFASIDMDNVNSTYITIMNMDLKGWNNGQLEADFELTRGIKTDVNEWAYLFTEYQKDVVLGQISCDSSCLIWYGPSANQWIVCANYATDFLYDGTWYSSCPSAAPYWNNYNHISNQTEYEGKGCTNNCGTGYFVDTDTNKCEQCNIDCQTCVDNQMSSCTTWSPIKYFYKGIWTETCPQPEYVAENTNYQCVAQNLTSYLSVQIIKPPYLHKIPKSSQFYLKAYINNSRGTISNVSWTQISPTFNQVTDNVFTMEYNSITNEPYNTQLTLRMRMTSFTFISEVTSIKILLEVQNSMNDTTTELTEFYINSSPTIGTITQEIISGETKPVSGSSQIRFRTSGWYDNIDDTTQQLSFMFYIIYNNQYYVLKDVGSLETFDINLPYISTSDDGTRVTLSACLLALDKYLSAVNSCISLRDVLINYNTTTMSSFTTSALAANINDNTELLNTAASMEALIPQYYRSPVQPHICTVDFQWYFGTCYRESGSNFCKCNSGYFGTNCQYQQSNFFQLKDISELMITQLVSTYGNASSIQTFDFYIILSTLKALLKDPELLEYTRITDIMNLFSKWSNIEDYKAISLQEFSLKLYFETAERILGKIYYERKMLKVDNSNIRYPGLDIQQIMAAEKVVMSELGAYGEQAHDLIMTFLKQIFNRIDTTTNTYIYLGDLAFEIKVMTGYPPDFEGTTFQIKESDVYWEIPYGIFSNHQNVASYVQQVYIIGIKWLANPFVLNSDEFSQVGTNTTSFSVYDNAGNELDIQNLTIPISIVIPYKKNTGYSKEFLQCQFYNETLNTFSSDGWGRSILRNVSLPCSTCAVDNSYTVTDVLKCRCSHLSTIGGVFKASSVSDRDDPRNGICVSYYALNYWKQSFGYYLCWPAMSVYFVGLIVAVVFDWLTISSMRAKIEKRIILVGELNKLHKQELEQERLLKKEEEKRLAVSPPEGAQRDKSSKLKPHTMNEDKIGHLSDDDKDNLEFEQLEEVKSHGVIKHGKKKKKIIKKKKSKKPEETTFNNFLAPDTHDDDFDKSSVNSDNTKNSKVAIEEEKKIELDETGQVINNSSKKKSKRKLIRKKKKPDNITTANVNGTNIIATNGAKIVVQNQGNPQENGNSDENKENKDDNGESMSDASEEEKDRIENMEPKYKFPSTVDIFEHHRGLWSMIAYSNPLFNSVFVTSYLCPRHIRASMMFSNAILIWFMVAVYYNNTKDPLVVPDFERSARDLATDELLLAMVIPLFTMQFSYIFWGIFRISDSRFHQPDAYDKVKSGVLMKALLNEMYLRFTMAYFIMVAIYGAVMWYIINFTAKFGWKVSWQWWYSGTFAYFINYFVYDPAVTWFHWAVYGCSEIMWRKIMAWRGRKIANPEILDDLHIPALSDQIQEYLEKKKLIQGGQNNIGDQEDGMIMNGNGHENSIRDDISVTNSEYSNAPRNQFSINGQRNGNSGIH